MTRCFRVLVLAAVGAGGCQSAGSAANPYDGAWTASIGNDGFFLDDAVAVLNGAFTLNGRASNGSPSGCNLAQIMLSGAVTTGGIMSGNWTSTGCDQTGGTFAGTCSSTSVCSAMGTTFSITLPMAAPRNSACSISRRLRIARLPTCSHQPALAQPPTASVIATSTAADGTRWTATTLRSSA